MSRLIIVILIFIIIIATSITSVVFVLRSEKELQLALDNIIQAALEEDMTKAKRTTEAFVAKWEKTEVFFIVLIRHHNIDEISKYVSRLTSFCEYNDYADLVAEVNMIKTILRRLSEDEKPMLHNIL